MVDPAFDTADYELLWPRALFARELAALRADSAVGMYKRVEFLLDEAFLNETPMRDFQVAVNLGQSKKYQYLDQLAEHTPLLREHHELKPYWSARRGQERMTAARMTIQRRFADLINDLHGRGYFGRALSDKVNPADVLAERLGIPDLWPLRPDDWDDGTFFSLIEVFHDLAVRPRERNHGPRWHYSAFATDTGRALYRWKINRLLESGGIELRLAEDGEDLGRLVCIVDDGRAELIERVLTTPEPDVADRVTHAIALFRGRSATEHDKRSAAITLAGILEERRQLIRAEIGKKDEGALFSIANEFAIRHQRRDQQGDYDPAFLDWIFWWYLATIELTDRILARQDAGKAS